MGADFYDLGPWFRTSSISYPEISDFQQAIEELCSNSFLLPYYLFELCFIFQLNYITRVLSSVTSIVAGYIVSLQPSEHPSKNDIKEALDLLNVSELREILSLVHLRVWMLWSIFYHVFILLKIWNLFFWFIFLKMKSLTSMLEWRCDCVGYIVPLKL